MFDIDRILAIPDESVDYLQMGISGIERAELKDRGFVRQDGTKAKDYMIRTIQKTEKNKANAEKAIIKGDKKLSEVSPSNRGMAVTDKKSFQSEGVAAKKIKSAIAGTTKSKKVTKRKSPDNRVPKKLGKLSNPVRELVIPDYPLGGNKRGEMRFYVESDPKKGERIVRQSKGNKPKYSTYSTKKAIATGEDGRTYLLSYEKNYGGMIRVARHDFMDAPDDYKVSEAGAFLDPRKPESVKAHNKAKKFIESAK